jgi:hypothetical protein
MYLKNSGNYTSKEEKKQAIESKKLDERVLYFVVLK